MTFCLLLLANHFTRKGILTPTSPSRSTVQEAKYVVVEMASKEDEAVGGDGHHGNEEHGKDHVAKAEKPPMRSGSPRFPSLFRRS